MTDRYALVGLCPECSRCGSTWERDTLDTLATADDKETLAYERGRLNAEVGVDAEQVWWAAWYFGLDRQPVTPPSPVLRDAVDGGNR